MHKISKYFRGVGEEARRIRWPDRRTLGQSVAKVLAIAIVAAAVTLLSDFLISRILTTVEELYPQASSSASGDSSVAAEAIRQGVASVKSLLGGIL